MIKQRLILLLILAMVFNVVQVSAYIEDNESISITGKVTSQQFNLAIQVINTLPFIEVKSPLDQNTYWDKQVFLNYTISSALNTWYSLNGAENITFENAIYLQTNNGQNQIIIYANNSQGEIKTEEIQFNVNDSILYINNSEYSGSSTDFKKYSLEQLQNLKNIVFEKPFYGEITFPNEINVTKGYENNNNINLNQLIQLNYNSFYVDSNNVPNFNKSATIKLNNIGFINPQILKDGSPCPVNTCTFIDYSSGTLIFNVTHFTNYSSRENPSSSGETEPKKSSGGSSGSASKNNAGKIEVFEDNNLFSIKQGETKQGRFIIENKKDYTINIELETSQEDNFILLPAKQFQIMPGQSLTVPFDIIVRENTLPELYVSQIIIKEDKNEIDKIDLVLDISSKKSLFDVRLNLIENELKKTDKIIAEIEIFNLGDTEKVDTEIEYIIRDLNNKEVYKEHETAAIQTQLNLVKIIKAVNLEPGKYILYIKTTYDGKIASASKLFEIKQEKNNSQIYYIMIILVFVSLLFYYLRNRNNESWFEKLENKIREDRIRRKVKETLNKKKISVENKAIEREITEKDKRTIRLEQQLKQLEYVHSQGLVDEKEYEITKTDIQNKINQLDSKK